MEGLRADKSASRIQIIQPGKYREREKSRVAYRAWIASHYYIDIFIICFTYLRARAIPPRYAHTYTYTYYTHIRIYFRREKRKLSEHGAKHRQPTSVILSRINKMTYPYCWTSCSMTFLFRARNDPTTERDARSRSKFQVDALRKKNIYI